MNIQKPSFKVVGKNKRVLIKSDGLGNIAVGRYPDMTKKEKDAILSICKNLMQDNKNLQIDLDKITAFIEFKSDDDEFCS